MDPSQVQTSAYGPMLPSFGAFVAAANIPPLAPGGDPPPDKQSGQKRVSKACDRCQKAKRGCPQVEGMIACQTCLEEGKECKYTNPDGRKRDVLKGRIAALEQELLQSKKKQRDKQGDNREMELSQMLCAVIATHPVLGSLRPPQNLRDNLPERTNTRSAIDAFFQSAAALFYVMTPEEASTLLDTVYDNGNASVWEIRELCALAAIGSQYQLPEASAEVRSTYSSLASTGLVDTTRADGSLERRIFICLCISSLVDERSTARPSCITALRLARGEMEAFIDQAVSTERRRVEYRGTRQTLVFLEGWLSYCLGYRHSATYGRTDLLDYQIACNNTGEKNPAQVTRLVQSRMAKLTVLAARIQDEMSTYRFDYSSHADQLSLALDTWHKDLPAEFHLQEPFISKPSARRTRDVHERALCLMHILHLDTRLQLYWQRLKASGVLGAERDAGFLVHFFDEHSRKITDINVGYAIQLSKIASHIHTNAATLARSWTLTQAVFDAGIVLFLGACRRDISSVKDIDVDDLFLHVKTCFTVLTCCSVSDLGANRLRHIIKPVCKAFERMHQDSIVKSSSDLSSELAPDLGPATTGSGAQESQSPAQSNSGKTVPDRMNIDNIVDENMGQNFVLRMEQFLKLIWRGGDGRV
ncbi:hypothetical protein BJY01DRAFT_244710 [Aspergillus pseudoustus]|uniref:Zn(2)-C6 fungal-type domain-containing protein n=1 Tax=Aspergillus pseudoustus TaxID=1810923 RepID=A0ABR4KIJ3_9EURO